MISRAMRDAMMAIPSTLAEDELLLASKALKIDIENIESQIRFAEKRGRTDQVWLERARYSQRMTELKLEVVTLRLKRLGKPIDVGMTSAFIDAAKDMLGEDGFAEVLAAAREMAQGFRSR